MLEAIYWTVQKLYRSSEYVWKMDKEEVVVYVYLENEFLHDQTRQDYCGQLEGRLLYLYLPVQSFRVYKCPSVLLRPPIMNGKTGIQPIGERCLKLMLGVLSNRNQVLSHHLVLSTLWYTSEFVYNFNCIKIMKNSTVFFRYIS